MRFVSVPLVFTFLIGLTLQSTNSSFLFRSLYAMTDSLDDEEDDETSCTVCTSWPFQVCPPLCLDTGLCFSITSLNWPFLFFPPNPSSLHDHEMYEATHNTVRSSTRVYFTVKFSNYRQCVTRIKFLAGSPSKDLKRILRNDDDSPVPSPLTTSLLIHPQHQYSVSPTNPSPHDFTHCKSTPCILRSLGV